MAAEEFTMNYEEIKWDYSRSTAAEDSFDFKAAEDDGEAGLLLPAVQSAREAARSSSADDSPQTPDSFQFEDSPDAVLIGLLLPAVQKAREADAVEDRDGNDLLIVNNGDGSDFLVDDRHDKWIDILSVGSASSTTADPVKEAGLRSDGELVQAVSDADMGGDFIF